MKQMEESNLLKINGRMKYVIQVAILLILAKGLGFFREIVMSYYYGTEPIMDIYSVSNASVNVFLGWFLVFSIMHTPFFQKIREKETILNAYRFTNQLVCFLILIGTISVFIISIFDSQLLSFVAIGFDTEKLMVASIFFRWAAVTFIITTISQVFMSELNCQDYFFAANVSNLAISGVQIITVFLSGYFNNIFLLQISSFLSSLFQLGLLSLFMIQKKRNWYIGNIYYYEFKKMFRLTIPLFLSSVMDELNTLVDKMFGSQLPEGSIASLNYAHLVKQLFFYVFASSIVTVMYPKISEEIACEDKANLIGVVKKGFIWMELLFVPITLIVMFYAKEITILVYQRGAFDEHAVQITAESLTMYGSALLPIALREIVIKIFQAMSNTKVNFYVGIISTILNILFNCLLVNYLKHMGLALATSLSAYISVPILFYFLAKYMKNLNIKREYLRLIKTFFFGLVSIIVSRIIFNSISIPVGGKIGIIIQCLLSLTIGFSIYLYVMIKSIIKKEGIYD